MSKKNYIQFANMYKGLKPVYNDITGIDGLRSALNTWNVCVIETARLFAMSNPNFNREKFLTACGYNENEKES